MILYSILGGNLISKVVCVFYPAFESLKALETEGGTDDKKWLTYWVIFGLITLGEQILAPILYIVPLYFMLKIAFFVYLFFPQTNGAKVVFERVINPLFLQNQAKIDSMINKAKDEFKNQASKITSTKG